MNIEEEEENGILTVSAKDKTAAQRREKNQQQH